MTHTPLGVKWVDDSEPSAKTYNWGQTSTTTLLLID